MSLRMIIRLDSTYCRIRNLCMGGHLSLMEKLMERTTRFNIGRPDFYQKRGEDMSLRFAGSIKYKDVAVIH